jgi:hypothetical protein
MLLRQPMKAIRINNDQMTDSEQLADSGILEVVEATTRTHKGDALF